MSLIGEVALHGSKVARLYDGPSGLRVALVDGGAELGSWPVERTVDAMREVIAKLKRIQAQVVVPSFAVHIDKNGRFTAYGETYAAEGRVSRAGKNYSVTVKRMWAPPMSGYEIVADTERSFAVRDAVLAKVRAAPPVTVQAVALVAHEILLRTVPTSPETARVVASMEFPYQRGDSSYVEHGKRLVAASARAAVVIAARLPLAPENVAALSVFYKRGERSLSTPTDARQGQRVTLNAGVYLDARGSRLTAQRVLGDRDRSLAASVLADELRAAGYIVNAPKRNSAVAQRRVDRAEHYTEIDDRGDERERTRWHDDGTPAHVTADHWTDPDVIVAAKVAASITRDYNKRLGAGNFGIGYRADLKDGTKRLVKIPAAYNLHEQPWTREQQTANILHEAGVANELAALGYSVIPRGHYVEWGGGTPAFVREFGEPVTSLSPAEYGEVERQLLSIERDHQWRVVDDLQMYRRADGSVFVSDVGIWQAPSKQTKTWSLHGMIGSSSLGSLLERLQQQTLPGLAVKPPSGSPRDPEYAYLDRVPMTTLASLADDIERMWTTEHSKAARPDRYAGKGAAFLLRMDAQAASDFLRGLAARDAFGIPTPDDIRASIPMARRLLALGAKHGGPIDDD